MMEEAEEEKDAAAADGAAREGWPGVPACPLTKVAALTPTATSSMGAPATGALLPRVVVVVARRHSDSDASTAVIKCPQFGPHAVIATSASGAVIWVRRGFCQGSTRYLSEPILGESRDLSPVGFFQSGQTMRIIGIDVATTNNSSGRPMRQ